MMKAFWNERYSQVAFAYGEVPNEYLKETLPSLSPGKILFVAEGEGRNAVYAATLGWAVTAFDQSEAGRDKAKVLAQKHDVTIDYLVADMATVLFAENSFDALVLIYAHFPEDKRRAWHQKLASFIKPGGRLILEGFAKQHVKNQHTNAKAGGPKEVGMLYDLEELRNDFPHFDIQEASELNTVLQEGGYHQGTASVIRLFLTKKTS